VPRGGKFYGFIHLVHLINDLGFLLMSLFVLKQKVTKKFKRNNPPSHKAIAGPELRFLPARVPI
jgi:hypothetical protein